MRMDFLVGSPGALFSHHASNAQRRFNLPHVLQAYPLEGQAGPGAMNTRIERMAPKSRITAGLLDELVIEERVVVDKLEKGILLLLTDGSVLADEAALLQLFQAGGKDTAVLQAVIINQLLALEAFGFVPQGLHNLDVTVRILE